MAENNNNKIFGIEKGELIKYGLYAEGGLLLIAAAIRMGLEAPKYCTSAGVATTVKAEALKSGTTSTYHVLNADITKIASKANFEAKLAENQLTNILIKTQAAVVEPVIGLVMPIEDVTFEKYVAG